MTPTTYTIIADDQVTTPGERHHIQVQFSQGDPLTLTFEFDGAAPVSDFTASVAVHLSYRDTVALAAEQAGGST